MCIEGFVSVLLWTRSSHHLLLGMTGICFYTHMQGESFVESGLKVF